jgi:eukaryotic-like serine/threonine-protein kinase
MPREDLLQQLRAALADRYRVERELGTGGMATVYLARDLRHDRDVAVKVLHPELGAALGAERFLAEIKTTARLQHPHILPLLDSGDAGGLYYVMPFVSGETLRSRLERERQLPVDEAVRIAREIADALSHAHSAGVIHRDIKPENILLQDGHARVADFGIALAVEHAAGTRLTQTGVSIGTPQYMAPEQAMGDKAIDARADIYALGAVLYETLAGEPPFTAPTAQAIVARVITETPRPLSTQRPSVPASVESAVLHALEKLPADRFSSAAEFAAALAGRGESQTLPGSAAASRRSARAPGLARTIAIAVAGFAIGAAGAWWLKPAHMPALPVARAAISLARGQLLSVGFSSFDISPDGTQLAYIGEAGGRTNLFLRALADTTSTLMPGTEGSTEPFFSPDGKWIGFFVDGKLVKMPRRGGVPITIASVQTAPAGVSWGNDGTILFSVEGSLYRVSSDGRSPARLVSALVAGKPLQGVRFPSFLPEERQALVTTDSGIGILSLASGELRLLTKGGQARYVPTGHLMYDDGEGRIRVVGFEPHSGRVIGTPRPAFEAFRASASGASFFVVSANGTLLYMPGGFARSLVWVDRNGRETPLPVERRGYRFPRISPDGRLIAISVDPRPSSIWILDPARGSANPITPAGRNSVGPTWSPDGKRVAFQTTGCICVLPVEGGAEPAPLRIKREPSPLNVEAWLRDGRLLGVRAAHAFQDPRDIITYAPGDSIVHPVVATPADDRDPAVSADEHWLAYASNVTGTLEIYVRPFPGPGPSVRVSTGGGKEPRWSRSGAELFFRNGGAIVAARISTSPSFRVVGRPETLFETGHDFTQDRNWDVGPDDRFLMVRSDPASRTSLVAVFNWFQEVREARPQ